MTSVWRRLSNSSVSNAAFSIAALVVMFVALLAFSLWKTSAATNQTDLDRTRAAIEAVVKNELSMLQGVNTDNAYWDDAFLATSAGKADAAFVESVWGAPTGATENQMYDTSIVINAGGDQLAGYLDGSATLIDRKSGSGLILRKLAGQLKPGQTSVATIAATETGPRMFAISRIKPLLPSLVRQAESQPPVYLGMSRRISGATLIKIEKLLLVKGVRIVSADTPNAAKVSDFEGRAALALSWDADAPGMRAIGKAAPVLVGGLLLCLFFAAVLFRFALRLLVKLHTQALVDTLSHLPNRRAIQLRLMEVVRTKQEVALAFIDLDGFKGINDNYGHGVGDALIRECADLITGLADGCEMVARLGGDEFAILATGPDAERQLEAVTEKFIARLNAPFTLGDRTVMIGASIGLSSAKRGEKAASELMRQADFAMYSAKTDGKMQITWFNPVLDEKQARAHQIEMRIRKHLATKGFSLEYQPIVDAKTHSMNGAEALIRWGEDEQGTLTPTEFIPVAEETGLIDSIGRYVLETACLDALHWGDDMGLSVNVSAAQLRNPHFPEIVKEVLHSTGFPANRLELEVTETYVIGNPDLARRQFEQLRELGVKIALDDFGTGYASVGYLRQFRFDKLKLDRSLVVDSITDDATRVLLNASITIAHSLDMRVVAEGVETLAQAQMMNVAGSDMLQGWHFSHSLSPSAMATVIAGGPMKQLAA